MKAITRFTLALVVAAASLMPVHAQKKATLVLTATTKYQHIDGFGGTGMNAQWVDTYTATKARLLWGKGETQIGLNIMRIRINPTVSAPPARGIYIIRTTEADGSVHTERVMAQ